MSRTVKSRLRKLEGATRGGTAVKAWSGTGPEPTLDAGDPRSLVVIRTGVPRAEDPETPEDGDGG